MQWWLILILAIILILILASLHPIRLWIDGRAAETLNLQIILKPFGIFPGKIKIVNIENRPWNQGKEKDNADTTDEATQKQDKPKEKKNFVEKLPFGSDDILPLIDKVLGGLQVEKLDLQANLSGDPYRSGVACGILWTFFGGGFAFLSHRVKKFTNEPKMNFGVDLERPWSADFSIKIMIRVGDLGRIGIHALIAIIRNRGKNKKATNNETPTAMAE